jgi:hypothetical protein
LKFLTGEKTENFKKRITINGDEENEIEVEKRDTYLKNLEKKANLKIEEMFSDLLLEFYPEINILDTYLKIKVRNINEKKPVFSFMQNDHSDGYKAIFKLLFFLHTNNQTPSRKIFIIDEIENHLHISVQAKLINKIEEILKEENNKNITLVTTTHAPTIILNKDFSSNVICLDEDKEGSVMIKTLGNDYNMKQANPKFNENIVMVKRALMMQNMEEYKQKTIYYQT